jgi:nucleoside-diphosphate-sugar epimerase
MLIMMKTEKLNKVLVTGATGFVGQALCRYLLDSGIEVVAAVRHRRPEIKFAGKPFTQMELGEIAADTDWTAALAGVETIFHLAARVHVMKDSSVDPLAEFRRVNVQGTENLARQAAHTGVKRLVYVSSIGVNGSQTAQDQSYFETDKPNPHNSYALSKWEAEQCLLRDSEETGLEVVIVRPPLVYGANAPGNFAQLLKVLLKGIPLPLASASNLRSFIYVGNLVDALLVCAIKPAAAGQTYLVSDGEDVSTPDLLRQLGAAMGQPARLLPCPPALLKLAGRVLGKSAQVERLLGSLQVDSSKIRRELGWRPPYTQQQGVQATAKWYRDRYCSDE